MDIFERQPRELNKNRKGPLKELWAIVDEDTAGNQIILRMVVCDRRCERPLVASEEGGFEALRALYFNLVKKSSRKIKLVRFTKLEILEG